MILCLAVSVQAQKMFNVERKIAQAFKIDPEQCELQLTNKYGMVNILPWQKDSIRIEISMKARSGNEMKAHQLLNSFDVELNHTGYFVIAKTVYTDKRETFLKDVSALTQTIVGGGSYMEINYTVYMPVQTNLKLENKFGNVYITQLTGKTSIKISNGDLKASALMGTSSIDIKFGNATINKMSSATLTVDYSHFDLNEANSIRLNSKSSVMNFDKIKHLDIDSKRDKIRVEQLDLIKGKSSFSNIQVSSLQRELTLDSKYSTLHVDAIDAGFRTINLLGSYTDLNAFFEKGSQFKIDITYSKNTTIICPDNAKMNETRMINEKELATSGFVGQPSAESSVKVNAKYGKIYLQVK